MWILISNKTPLLNLLVKLLLRHFQAMAFGIYLVDSDSVNVYKLENKRKINIGRIDKILKVRR